MCNEKVGLHGPEGPESSKFGWPGELACEQTGNPLKTTCVWEGICGDGKEK